MNVTMKEKYGTGSDKRENRHEKKKQAKKRDGHDDWARMNEI